MASLSHMQDKGVRIALDAGQMCALSTGLKKCTLCTGCTINLYTLYWMHGEPLYFVLDADKMSGIVLMQDNTCYVRRTLDAEQVCSQHTDAG
jgi:hypothetical protein